MTYSLFESVFYTQYVVHESAPISLRKLLDSAENNFPKVLSDTVETNLREESFTGVCPKTSTSKIMVCEFPNDGQCSSIHVWTTLFRHSGDHIFNGHEDCHKLRTDREWPFSPDQVNKIIADPEAIENIGITDFKSPVFLCQAGDKTYLLQCIFRKGQICSAVLGNPDQFVFHGGQLLVMRRSL